jgi:DNA-binding Lrp family transcriptional regulator
MRNNPYVLSKNERSLLHLLEKNARQPYSYYAKKLKTSPESVRRMIAKLQKEVVIDNFYTIINLPKIGYMFCRAFITYNKITAKEEEHLLKSLRDHPAVGWIITCEGQYDLVVIFMVKSIEDLKNATQDFFSGNAKIIKDKDISIQTQLFHYNHNYLYDGKDYEEIKYRDLKNPVTPDGTDMDILRMLAKDARVSTLEISEKLKIPYNTVKNRINRMLADKVILGFKPKINPETLGYSHFKIFLKLEKLDAESRKTVKDYLAAQENVVYITKALGNYDLEFEVELKNRRELNQFMRDLRNKLFELIREHTVLEHYSEPYINYLP